jgi:hypothetical protein
MALRDGYLYELTPAELIAWVAKVTLATISNMTTAELVRIGWYNNPVVDILYSMTSAGVWVAKTDASGRVTEANSTNMVSHTSYMRYSLFFNLRPFVNEAPQSTTTLAAGQERIQVVPFTSNAGGGLDADVDLSGAVGAKTGYFMVIDEIFFMSLDYGGASTPTMVFSTTTHNAFRTHGALTVTGDNQVNKQLEDVPIYYIDDDDEAIFLDTGCTDLGNTKSWLAFVKFHFET